MHDYRKLAMALGSLTEKDLILFEISLEEKAHLVKQFNRALYNARGEGTDVAQIILKPLIVEYPTWGDISLVYGLCLAIDKKFDRAIGAIDYSVNNTLITENSLTVAKEAIRLINEDMKDPNLRRDDIRRTSSKNWTQVVAVEDGGGKRVHMQAPILTKANGMDKFQMASDKERRDIMMRSASAEDDRNGTDIEIESPRSSGEKMRTALKILAIILAIALLIGVVVFFVLPLIVKVRNGVDTQNRLDYIIGELDTNKDDPEVASIIEGYYNEFSKS